MGLSDGALDQPVPRQHSIIKEIGDGSETSSNAGQKGLIWYETAFLKDPVREAAQPSPSTSKDSGERREVVVEVTKSKTTGQVKLTVSGRDISLRDEGEKWTARELIDVVWPLTFVFESAAGQDEQFEMMVSAKHLVYSSKDKKDTFRGRSDSGQVVIRAELR